MKKLTVIVTAFLSLSLGIGLGSQALGAPPAADPPIDLELKEVPAGDVLRLLGEAQGKRVEIDPCVTAKIDVKLMNVPVSVVESALIHKLGLTRAERDGATIVGCAPRPASK